MFLGDKANEVIIRVFQVLKFVFLLIPRLIPVVSPISSELNDALVHSVGEVAPQHLFEPHVVAIKLPFDTEYCSD